MLNRCALKCLICSIVVVCCGGKPLGNTPPKSPIEPVKFNLIHSKNNTSPQIQVLQDLFGLLNKTVVQTLVMDHNNVTQGSLSTDKLQQLLSLVKPMSTKQPFSTALENRFQEVSSSSPQPPRVSTRPSVNTFTSSQFPLTFSPPGASLSGYFSNETPGQSTSPGEPISADLSGNQPLLQNGGQEDITSTKSALESQKHQSFEDRLPAHLPSSSVPSITSSKSPLEYNPQRPFYAGQTAGGRPGQLIPPGAPLPAGNVQQIPQNRFPEISTGPSMTSSKSPLEYNPQRPFFAGQTAGGRPGQLIPPGEPLPPGNVQQTILLNNSSQQSLEDRIQAPTAPPSNQSEINLSAAATPISTFSTTTILPLTTSTRSPLDYNNQRPFFASQVSSGRPGQLIPPGEPWPADPPTVQNRFPDTPSKPEGNRQRPFLTGQFSNGRPGQLIPHGNPWPTDTSGTKSLVQDKFLSYTPSVQYRPGSDSLERQFANGGPDGLIPPRGSWPTNPLEVFDYAYF